MPKTCSHCGAALNETAKFCHRCGTATSTATSAAKQPAPPSSGGIQNVLPWAVAVIALLCLLAFIVGQNWRRAQTVAAPIATAPSATRAPDISQMSPDERADRLFNRVMTYVSAGQSDSAQFFSPMAIQSFRALAPLTAHRRYDLGLLGVVSGDGAMARAQADSILAEQPDHLLGLILAMRASGLQLDTVARRGYSGRFLQALPGERAKRLPEYIDHQPDIDAAVRESDRRAPSTPTPYPSDDT